MVGRGVRRRRGALWWESCPVSGLQSFGDRSLFSGSQVGKLCSCAGSACMDGHWGLVISVPRIIGSGGRGKGRAAGGQL